jgi:hypothetical protein
MTHFEFDDLRIDRGRPLSREQRGPRDKAEDKYRKHTGSLLTIQLPVRQKTPRVLIDPL